MGYHYRRQNLPARVCDCGEEFLPKCASQKTCLKAACRNRCEREQRKRAYDKRRAKAGKKSA